VIRQATARSPRGLRYRKVQEKDVPWVVRQRNWRTTYFGFLGGLVYATQTCKYTADDGTVSHYAYVERNGRRRGPWLVANERLSATILRMLRGC
jgi:hypothetical protein